MEMQSVLDVIILKNSRNEFTKLSSGSKHFNFFNCVKTCDGNTAHDI